MAILMIVKKSNDITSIKKINEKGSSIMHKIRRSSLMKTSKRNN